MSRVELHGSRGPGDGAPMGFHIDDGELFVRYDDLLAAIGTFESMMRASAAANHDPATAGAAVALASLGDRIAQAGRRVVDALDAHVDGGGAS